MLAMEKDHLFRPQRERVITLIYKQPNLSVIKEDKLLKGIKIKKKEEKFDLINININLIIELWTLKTVLFLLKLFSYLVNIYKS